MEKLYFFFMLLVIPVLCFPVNNNEKKVFATDGTIWNIEHGDGEIYYALIGDTVIDSKLYNRLYAIGDTVVMFSHTSKERYVGGYREENGQVWFRPGRVDQYSTLKEVLVYDFTKNPGDEIEIEQYFIYPSTDPFSVEFSGPQKCFVTISDITTDSDNRRHIHISFAGYDDEWIEGLGGNSGLFWTNLAVLVGGGSGFIPELMCVKQGDDVLYLNNPNCDRCFCKTISNIPENPQNKIKVNVFPNPVKDNLNVTISEEMLPCMMNLYSPTGDFVTGKRITEVSETVNMKGQETGLYLYRVTTDGGELLNSGKIIKK